MSITAAARVTLRIESSLTDDRAVSDIVDEAIVQRLISVAHGAGLGQCNQQWQGKVAVAASSVAALDFAELPVTVFGGDGARSFSAVKLAYVRNLGPAKVDLSAWPAVSSGGVSLPSGATLLLTEYASGFNTSGEVLEVYNDHATNAAEVQILFLGVS